MKITTDKEQAQQIAVATILGAKIADKEFPLTSGVTIGHRWEWADGTPCANAGGGLHGWGWNDFASANELPNFHTDANASLMLIEWMKKERDCYWEAIHHKDGYYFEFKVPAQRGIMSCHVDVAPTFQFSILHAFLRANEREDLI